MADFIVIMSIVYLAGAIVWAFYAYNRIEKCKVDNESLKKWVNKNYNENI